MYRRGHALKGGDVRRTLVRGGTFWQAHIASLDPCGGKWSSDRDRIPLSTTISFDKGCGCLSIKVGRLLPIVFHYDRQIPWLARVHFGEGSKPFNAPKNGRRQGKKHNSCLIRQDSTDLGLRVCWVDQPLWTNSADPPFRVFGRVPRGEGGARLGGLW